MHHDNEMGYGISSIGIALPETVFDVKHLANLRNVPEDKYTLGLGCQTMALARPDQTVVDFAANAAQKALERWQGSKDDIGLIVVGTESAVDMSRPLSAFVAEQLGLQGRVRSYEVKHACYGGTLALRQALEWKASGASQGKAALVIAADIALYAPSDPGEPTQGAGAIAMIIDKPIIASLDLCSYYYSEPAFDFWRPVMQHYPSVEGKFSLDCYMKAAVNCFTDLIGNQNPKKFFETITRVCFHTPFPKMVYKAVHKLGEAFGWCEEEIQQFFAEKVIATFDWNKEIGNTYTASLWISVANVLAYAEADQKIIAFSYGSGFGSEIQTITVHNVLKPVSWLADWENYLAKRKKLTAEEYLMLRDVK